MDADILVAARRARKQGHSMWTHRMPTYICGYCGRTDCGSINRGQHHWMEVRA